MKGITRPAWPHLAELRAQGPKYQLPPAVKADIARLIEEATEAELLIAEHRGDLGYLERSR